MTCGSLAHAVAFGYHSPAMEPADTTRGSYPLERRTFMALVSGGLLAAPLAAEAEQAGKSPRIGLLDYAPFWGEPLREGLRDLGYVEGQNGRLRRAPGRPIGRDKVCPMVVVGLVGHVIDTGRVKNREQAFVKLEALGLMTYAAAKDSFYAAGGSRGSRRSILNFRSSNAR